MAFPRQLANLVLEFAGPLLKHRVPAAQEKRASELASQQKKPAAAPARAAQMFPLSSVKAMSAEPPLLVMADGFLATVPTVLRIELIDGAEKSFELPGGTKIALVAGIMVLPPCKGNSEPPPG